MECIETMESNVTTQHTHCPTNETLYSQFSQLSVNKTRDINQNWPPTCRFMKPVQRGWVAQVGSAIILQQICPQRGKSGWSPEEIMTQLK